MLASDFRMLRVVNLWFIDLRASVGFAHGSVMQKPKVCPHCESVQFIRRGKYFIQHSRSWRQRYKCQNCGRTFSNQTSSKTYYQKKPFLNDPLFRLLCNGNSQRGSARLLGCSKNTVSQKFLWLCRHYTNNPQNKVFDTIQIDEMESIEHTKLKPVTIALAVSDQYELLSLQTGRIPAKGHLAKISVKKYGFHENQREKALHLLFQELQQEIKGSPRVIRTDGAPIYKQFVKKYFPKSIHETVVSRDLLKKKRELIHESAQNKPFDPMFALNQRCAKLRSDIKRLTRRSWCTTKRLENLQGHLKLYQRYNNANLPR